MATLIKTRDHRSVKHDCDYLQTHYGFKGEKRWICTCKYKLLPDNCTGCTEYGVSGGLEKFAEQVRVFEDQVVQYQLAASVRDEAEAERVKVSEWLVTFLCGVPRDAKGKIRLDTAHHSVSLVEPTASRNYNIEKVKDLFASVGARATRRKMSFDVEVPDGVDKEILEKAVSVALKKFGSDVVFATGVMEEVSQDAIDGALKLGIISVGDLESVTDVVTKKSYPKVSDKSEAVVRESMI